MMRASPGASSLHGAVTTATVTPLVSSSPSATNTADDAGGRYTASPGPSKTSARAPTTPRSCSSRVSAARPEITTASRSSPGASSTGSPASATRRSSEMNLVCSPARINDVTFTAHLLGRSWHLLSIRIGNHDVADESVEVAARRDELPERAPSRCELIELRDAETVLIVRTTEIREMREQLVDNLRMHRVVDARDHRDVAGVQSLLPCVRRRDNRIGADHLAPVHVVAKRRREQPDPVPTLAEKPIRLLENGHTRPLEIAGIDA